MLKEWLVTRLGIYRRRFAAELEIMEKVSQMNLSDEDRDNITIIVKETLDKHFQ